MYAHESTCTRCGSNFVVEVVPGQPMRPRGICDDCEQMERYQAAIAAEAARRAEEEARKRQLIKWGIIVGGAILLALLISYACA